MSLVPRCFATPGPVVEASEPRSVGSAAAADVVSVDPVVVFVDFVVRYVLVRLG